jgi:hypothetical protein
VNDGLALIERRLRRLPALDLPEHVVQRAVDMLIGMQNRQQQVIVQHLRIALQRRQHLRKILHGLVVDELRKAAHLVEHARVELADDGEGLSQFRADLVGRDADLLFGRDHLEIGVGPGVGEPLEVPFDHRTL